jgi:putative flippase GtrA
MERKPLLSQPMFKQELIVKFVRSALVGGLVAAVFMGLNWLLGPPHRSATTAFFMAYPFALLLHFCLNRWWAFEHTGPIAVRQVFEYLAMVLVTFLVQWTVFRLMLRVTALPGWIDAGVANATQMVLGFVVMKRRIFAPQR